MQDGAFTDEPYSRRDRYLKPIMIAVSSHEKPADTSESAPKSSTEDYPSEPIVSKNYFFGAQGKALVSQISIAGGLGFFLFGYDQGVLGVSRVVFLPKATYC